jgi:PAP2 superfamily
MIWVDRQIGFDRLAVMRVLDDSPVVLALLDAAYATFTSQLIATVLVLIRSKRTSELDHFFITFMRASAIAEIANVLLPTLGPMSVMAAMPISPMCPRLAERRRTLSSHCVTVAGDPSTSARSTELSAFRPCMPP